MTGAMLLEGWPLALLLALAVPLWIGHACIWTTTLNHLYARRIPKWFLRPYRLLTGGQIVGFPLILWGFWVAPLPFILGSYLVVCGLFGLVLFPIITWKRNRRTPPAELVRQETETIDYWAKLGQACIGDGYWQWMTRLPFTCAFTVDFTRYTLRLPNLPPRWNGLRILLLSDLHFHGTPSREFYNAVFQHLQQREVDLILLAGDVVDTDLHLAWVMPLLGSLQASQGKYAILGNHDEYHVPEKVRDTLQQAGYTVLGNDWKSVSIREERCVMVGHEGPWFLGEADLTNAPSEPFRLLISHTPDNYPWARQLNVKLMVSGHVHGGQIRLPIIGSIFVPSIFGRRYDEGIFKEGETLLVVNRGLSGKEPLRFRCHPQVIELTLLAEQPRG